jgi:hypothetical protein
MAIPKKAYLDLGEVAKAVSKATGDQVSSATILDWAGQKLLRLWVIAEQFKVMRPDSDSPELVKGFVGVEIDLVKAIALARGESIQINSCVVDGVILKLVRFSKVDGHAGRYVPDTASISITALRVASSDLDIFIKSYCAPIVPTASLNTHSTKLLEMLHGANYEFWSDYKPSDRNSAPTNEEVREWLKGQRVSPPIASAMATILRADGLKTGRKKVKR